MKTIEVPAKKESLDAVMAFIRESAALAPFGPGDWMKIELAVEEAFVNIASYAYGNGEGMAEIGCALDGSTLRLRLVDGGAPYNPLKKADPDITLSAEDRQIGGLGIFLVKQLMDEVDYHRQENKNILEMSLRGDGK